ncbi:MAG: adenosylhomocysteinase [Methanocellales archaeon]|nr:adenosylhomocysteinase [Methanocellales archaeon]MDD3291077.1 adenosylhomocysteinase [Methanocellales archaeon]MDD5234962.1 adenosylhomocysteinase [Methanocellales archaeon]MDD5484667.1 adenosylhomocysteinase [Methanocellales archaeon]
MGIKTLNETEKGKLKIEWARKHMPVLEYIRGQFEREKPLRGHIIGMALHVEAKTAVLVETLVLGGAEVAITGCNPLSTQDDVALALNQQKNVECYAKHDCPTKEYYEAIDKVLDHNPDITIDDGADLIFKLHTDRRELLPHIIGACEETTTGVHRLRAMQADGKLEFPVIAINDARAKFLFDNRYGTGQSTLDGIIRTTNLLIAGKNVVIAGYGWCGRGVAMRAKGHGANVLITEVDPVRALEAQMDGYRVMPMDKAASIGDLFITTTGNKDVITKEHFRSMKDGAILANSGHFNLEINVDHINEIAKSIREVRANIDEYDLGDKKIYLLSKGRLVNLASGDGHPIEVMDMSFSLQALCVRYIVEHSHGMKSQVYDVPQEIDELVARLKLKSMQIDIDQMSAEQKEYVSGWKQGT